MKYIKKFNTAKEVVMYDPFNLVLVADTDTVLYDVPTIYGVYIQHIDGSLYTTEEWATNGFANEYANGVAVITEECSFVIAKENISTSMEWSSSDYTLVEGILTAADEATAKTDFAGQENTNLMLAADTRCAGYSCANYTFPNGVKGYLPALGEWSAAYANKDKIASAMSLIGGTSIAAKAFWSSTQISASSAWTFSYYNGNVYGQKKYEPLLVRAFSAFVI